ncbi:hypothetical protein M408DRAFT_328544 [Serendipita vermifera MAFF 305830]|uniref:Uncharacterized protein n=1 Tax=Serendipita vermifera MAFF 305830 TaxID=933852 RepID=A0A0C2WU57_SERVB|nr:hypothetical protein M408DRAFT_328544 [Serendipita vermifera MAFF 305830]
MRLSSATLLLGATSVLSALLASAAPVLIRISLAENDVKPARDTDDFFRYVRLGAAAAAGMDPPVGQSNNSGEDNDEMDLESLHAAWLMHSSSEGDNGNDKVNGKNQDGHIPMTPDMEFTPDSLDPTLHAIRLAAHANISTVCNMNLWQRMVGRINNFFVDLFGLPEESRRAQCPIQPVQVVQRPPPQSAPTSHAYTTRDRMIAPTATAQPGAESTPYHRNGSPIAGPNAGSPSATVGTSGGLRNRPWGGRRPRPATSFAQRVQRALYALSPWEGRAVAFVMGCGLGVILRMLFVFVVLGLRFLSSKTSAGCRDSQCAVALCGLPSEDDDEDEMDEDEKEKSVRVLLGDEEVEGVILFDAGSLKGASMEDLLVYSEKQ